VSAYGELFPLDVVIRARDEASETLRGVARTSEETIQTIVAGREKSSEEFRRVHGELLQHRTALKDLNYYYREQHESLSLALSAYGSFVGVLRQTQSMYMQYNVAMLRVEDIQRRITDAQEKYNDALQRYGAGSRQARDAARDLADAQGDLEVAQLQNNLMLAGFILQMPYFAKGILDMITKVQALTAAYTGAAAMRALAEYGPIVGAALAAGVVGAGVGYAAAQARIGGAGMAPAQGAVGGGVTIESMTVNMNPRGMDPEEASADLFERLNMRLRASRPET
jgi:hypothetical protein